MNPFTQRHKQWSLLPYFKYLAPNLDKLEPGYLERTSVLYFVGAASSRDRFNSRLEAAPTGVFQLLGHIG